MLCEMIFIHCLSFAHGNYRAENKLAIGQFPTIITHFRELVNIFGTFSDYWIGHPFTLQAAATFS